VVLVQKVAVEEKLNNLARFAGKLGYAAPVGLLNRSQPLFESSSALFFPSRATIAFHRVQQRLRLLKRRCSASPLTLAKGAVASVGARRAVGLHLEAKLALLSFARSIGLRSNEASRKDSTMIHIKAVLREKDVLTKQTNQSQIKTGYVQ
jgi:hypothetical protein